MATKYKKIKRHKIHYNKRQKGKGVLKTILFIVLILVLVFLAYSIAGPIKKLMTGELSSSSEVSSNTSSFPPSGSSSEVSSQLTSAPPIASAATKAVVLSYADILDSVKFDAFLAKAKADGYHAVMLELKDEEGKIYFNSSVSSINGKKAIVDNAADAAALVKKVKDAGLTPLASIHVFKDKTAPDKSKGNTFMVKNSTYTWFDKAANNGGKPWLNPYKEPARSYNTMIVEDLAKAGFTEIILKSVQFPEVRNMNKAQLDDSNSISGILSQYVSEAETAAKKYGAKISISYPSVGYWEAKTITYGGEASEIKASRISPVIDLSAYGDELKFGETVIASPKTNINASIKAVIDQIQTKTALQKSEIIPIIASGQNTAEIVKALEECGIQNYIAE